MANEKAVSLALQHLNLTRIVIAHRPETIASAQRQIHMGPSGLVEGLIEGITERFTEHFVDGIVPAPQQTHPIKPDSPLACA
jgi:hypothetical protein